MPSKPSEPNESSEADDSGAIEDAIEYLRGHLSGLLQFDGEIRPVKVILTDEGQLAAPVMVAMLRSFDTTLCLPDDDDTSLHLQVTLEEFDERGTHAALADRWRIYHGDPPDVRWATMHIDAARCNGLFIDGDAITRPNLLATRVPALCRSLNGAHTDLVRDACHRAASIVIERPVVVGIDQLGIDVRGAFDVVRLAADEPIAEESDVIALLRRLATLPPPPMT